MVLAGVAAGWGTIPVMAGLVHIPSALIVAARLWTASLCLGAAVWWRRRRDRRLRRALPPVLLSVRPGLCLVVAGILAFHWLALFAAYQRAPAGTVILIVYLAPIGVAAIAPRLIGERLSLGTISALVAATIGFGLVALPTVRSAGAGGLILSLMAALLFVFLIVLSKPLAEVYGGLQLAFMEMAGAGLVLVPVAAVSRWPHPSPTWLWLLVLGVVHTAVGISLYLWALADLPATHVGILGYLEPVGVVVCAWVFLAQRPAVETVLGGLLVVGAGVMVVALGRSDVPPAIPRITGPEVRSQP